MIKQITISDNGFTSAGTDFGAIDSAYGYPNAGLGHTPVNCSFSTSTGKTLVTLTWTYPLGVNPADIYGSIDVYINGQIVPRFKAGSTAGAYYTEVSPNSILLDQDYSTWTIDIEVIQRATVIDTSTQNTTAIATLNSEVATINSQINKIPTRTTLTSGSGTYTTPAGVLYLRVRMLGGGGGGAGSGAGSGGTGGTGGTTTFGISLLTATGGTGGGVSQVPDGGNGGSGSVSLPAHGFYSSGGGGSSGAWNNASTQILAYGGAGGSSALGGGAPSQPASYSAGGTGIGAPANSGGGGSGASCTFNLVNGWAGGGGGAGGYVDAIIPTPSATYAYTVGFSGASGIAGSSGFLGGIGGSGVIIIEECYQ